DKQDRYRPSQERQGARGGEEEEEEKEIVGNLTMARMEPGSQTLFGNSSVRNSVSWVRSNRSRNRVSRAFVPKQSLGTRENGRGNSLAKDTWSAANHNDCTTLATAVQ